MKSIIRNLPLYIAVGLCALVLYAPSAEAGGGGTLKSKTFARGQGGGYAQVGYSKGGGLKLKAGFGAHVKPKSHGGWGYAGKHSGYGKPTSHGKGFGHKQYGYKKYGQKGYGYKSYGHKVGYGYGPKKVWVPGSWTLHKKKVWVPGSYQKVWHPPVFETHHQACGTAYQVQISAGYYEKISTPGHWEWQSQRVWSPAHWEYVH